MNSESKTNAYGHQKSDAVLCFLTPVIWVIGTQDLAMNSKYPQIMSILTIFYMKGWGNGLDGHFGQD